MQLFHIFFFLLKILTLFMSACMQICRIWPFVPIYYVDDLLYNTYVLYVIIYICTIATFHTKISFFISISFPKYIFYANFWVKIWTNCYLLLLCIMPRICCCESYVAAVYSGVTCYYFFFSFFFFIQRILHPFVDICYIFREFMLSNKFF